MEQFYFHQSLHQAAKAEERIHLARELRDGLLQSLTGVTMQAEAASKLLSDIRSLVKVEQQELRKFVQQLKPGGSYLVDTALL